MSYLNLKTSLVSDSFESESWKMILVILTLSITIIFLTKLLFCMILAERSCSLFMPGRVLGCNSIDILGISPNLSLIIFGVFRHV